MVNALVSLATNPRSSLCHPCMTNWSHDETGGRVQFSPWFKFLLWLYTHSASLRIFVQSVRMPCCLVSVVNELIRVRLLFSDLSHHTIKRFPVGSLATWSIICTPDRASQTASWISFSMICYQVSVIWRCNCRLSLLQWVLMFWWQLLHVIVSANTHQCFVVRSVQIYWWLILRQ